MGLVNERLKELNNVNRIVMEDKTYEELLISSEELYEILSSYILDSQNLFYYCTQRSSCRTVEDTRKYIKKIFDNGLLSDKTKEVLISLGWDKDNLDINSDLFSGDLGEYLMNIIVSKFKDAQTLISKVSLKTSPKMPAYGNDNIFYDYDKKILYYGESKFYSTTSKALREAYKSINLHLSGATEFSYIVNHSSSYIAENGDVLRRIEQLMENVKIEEVTIKSISFVMSDDKYKEKDYKELLETMVGNGTISKNYAYKSIIIFLPIISKQKFLSFFEKEVKKIYE